MVSRLRSAKGSFVRSPKGAFETGGLQLSAQLTILAVSINPNTYIGFNPLSCAFAQIFFLGTQSLRWTMTIQDAALQPIPTSVTKSLVFEQAPSVQQLSIPAHVAVSNTCIDGQSNENLWAPPLVAGQAGADLYDVQWQIPPYNSGSNFQQVIWYEHPGSGLSHVLLPDDWVTGQPIQIVAGG